MRLLKFLLPAVLLLSAGCTRRVVQPVETVHIRSDTLRTESLRVDSVILRDSVIVIERGDTLIREVWRHRERILRNDDRSQHTRTDTLVREIPVEVERRIEVERQPTAMERLRMKTGDIAIVIILISAIYLILKFRKR